MSERRRLHHRHIFVGIGLLLCVVMAGVLFTTIGALRSRETARTHVDDTVVRSICSGCHLFPEPETFPRSAWWKTIHNMVKMPGYAGGHISTDAVVAWFEERAPESLDLTQSLPNIDSSSIKWRRSVPDTAYGGNFPFVSNVQFLDLIGDARQELVVGDMAHGMVLLGKPYESSYRLERLAMVANPAHATRVDLDRDGLQDVIVGNLGSFNPLDHEMGSVEWLRQIGPKKFEPVSLFDGLGRVADVRPVDLDADGDWDLVVGEFGWRESGRVFVLENVAHAGEQPQFAPHDLDARHGAIHVEIADLNHDGLPDFVTNLAQEHEMVVAYLNQGGFVFEAKQLYRAPHPAWGSSGMQLVDLDGDDDLDILLTNGDMFDGPGLRPYHGIEWLEQTGSLEFTPHRLVQMYGAHRAAAADLDGDGDLDIVACSFMPEEISIEGQQNGLIFNSLIWLEQTGAGEFVPHSLEQNRPQHATLALGDYDLDGDTDIAVGNAFFRAGEATERLDAVDLWENLSVDLE